MTTPTGPESKMSTGTEGRDSRPSVISTVVLKGEVGELPFNRHGLTGQRHRRRCVGVLGRRYDDCVPLGARNGSDALDHTLVGGLVLFAELHDQVFPSSHNPAWAISTAGAPTAEQPEGRE